MYILFNFVVFRLCGQFVGSCKRQNKWFTAITILSHQGVPAVVVVLPAGCHSGFQYNIIMKGQRSPCLTFTDIGHVYTGSHRYGLWVFTLAAIR